MLQLMTTLPSHHLTSKARCDKNEHGKDAGRTEKRRGRCGAAALTCFDSYGEGLAFCAVLVGDFAGHPILQDLGCGFQGQGAHHLVSFHWYRLKEGNGGAFIDSLIICDYFACIASFFFTYLPCSLIITFCWFYYTLLIVLIAIWIIKLINY